MEKFWNYVRGKDIKFGRLPALLQCAQRLSSLCNFACFFLLCCFAEAFILKGSVTAAIHGGTGGGAIAGACHIKVVKAGSELPVPGAFVMVGLKAGVPFDGNFDVTDNNGEITFRNLHSTELRPSLPGLTAIGFSPLLRSMHPRWSFRYRKKRRPYPPRLLPVL